MYINCLKQLLAYSRHDIRDCNDDTDNEEEEKKGDAKDDKSNSRYNYNFMFK